MQEKWQAIFKFRENKNLYTKGNAIIMYFSYVNIGFRLTKKAEL